MKLLSKLAKSLGKGRRKRREQRMLAQLRSEIDDSKVLAAGPLVRAMRSSERLDRLADAEFKVFSQFGDDGIIQYLVNYLGVAPQTFVEFGVENYREANTRFLLINDNWRGLVMDCSSTHIETIRRDDISWRHDLTAAAAFVTRDNIESLLADNGFIGELGILSIDIDGNDYWVWQAIQNVQPRIVIAEYNSVFGSRRAVTIPYDPDFYRTAAHHSNLYWGCSLKSLCLLAEEKGYCFVGCNSAGNNAYFVRSDSMRDLRALSSEEGYVESRFRESRSADGSLSFLAGKQRLQAIAAMPVFDVELGREIETSQINEAA